MELYTIVALVENHAGVLSQISRLFSRRGYNIESLAVGVTDDPLVSRITIILAGDEQAVRQIVKQLAKQLSVIKVKVLPDNTAVCRELLLIKVKADSRLIRDEVIQIANIFRARIIDLNMKTVTVEITGEDNKTEALIKLLSEFGIIEMARTGMIALERGEANIHSENG